MRVNTKKAPQKGAFFVWVLACLCSLFSEITWANCNATAIDEHAIVDYVYDGDTIHLKDGRKIRIIGMDTPEVARENKAAEPYSEAARRTLIQLIGKSDRIGLLFDKESKDKYGRRLAHVYNNSGRNVTESMLNQGLARMMIVPPNTRFSECYYQQETKARKSGIGLWSLPAYRVISAANLSKNAHGYRVVSGEVVKIESNKHSIWLLLDNKLSVHIKKMDLENFKGMRINDLKGKRLVVRGKVFRSKRGPVMLLRHSSAMELAS